MNEQILSKTLSESNYLPTLLGVGCEMLGLMLRFLCICICPP